MKTGTGTQNLNIEDLNICEAYQRTIVKAQVRRICRHFDKDSLGLPCVGVRVDGSHWVVDGQQRIEALKILGHQTVTCEIFHSNGPAHEASVFRHKNKDRTGITAGALFKARITEGEESAVCIKATAERCGFRISYRHGGTDWPHIGCVAALDRIYERGGVRHLEDVLTVVHEAWEGETSAIHNSILSGLSTVLSKCGDHIDLKRLVQVLSRKSPIAITRMSDKYRGNPGDGGLASAIAKSVIELYNKRLSQKKRIEA